MIPRLACIGIVLFLLRPLTAAPLPLDLPSRAEAVLASVAAEEPGWIKIHAADVLVALGRPDAARKAVAAEDPFAFPPLAHRIGLMRIQAQAAPTPGERSNWLKQIEAVFLDASAPDRAQAIESLAKLKHPLSREARQAAEAMADESSERDAALALWALVNSGDAGAAEKLSRLLLVDDGVARLRASYALRWLESSLDPAIRARVAAAATTEPSDSPAYAYVIASALTLNQSHPQAAEWEATLGELLLHGAPNARYEAAQALMPQYDPARLDAVRPLFEHAHGDVRLAAAWLVLHVLQR